MTSVSRRRFLADSAITAATVVAFPMFGQADHDKSPFKIAVISDEISQDFDHACSVISKDFGLHWVELRAMWGRNMQNLSDPELSQAEAILMKYGLRVTDIGSPLFKTDWPVAPRSKFSPKNDSFRASFDFKHQQEVLERSIRRRHSTANTT